MTVVVREPQGPSLNATVFLRPSAEAVEVELIAHELEHIVEQLDDVDLAAMSDRSNTAVRFDRFTGRYETDRAIAAGRRVRADVLHAKR